MAKDVTREQARRKKDQAVRFMERIGDPRKCHINYVVLDSGWEGEFCRVMENHPRVVAYAKNHNLGLEVPYVMGGQPHRYLPDFVVLVDDGHGPEDLLHLIVEIKGYRGEDAKFKKEAMETRWIPGVNNDGSHGRWAFLDACGQYEGNQQRMRALVLLLRFTGLRIGDAVRLSRERIKGDRLFLYTQKTGVPVWCPLPPVVLEALDSFEPLTGGYFFWSGCSNKDGVARTYMTRLRKIFRLAGIQGGRSHRFRDTFAVELLLTGVPLERVAVLLGHSSIRVTEKHYAPWIRERQEQLEADIRQTWARNRDVLGSTNRTSNVHEKMEAVN